MGSHELIFKTNTKTDAKSNIFGYYKVGIVLTKWGEKVKSSILA